MVPVSWVWPHEGECERIHFATKACLAMSHPINQKRLMIQRVTSRNLAILSSLLYSLAFPFKKFHALIHLTDPFCQASDGGLHFGSESGVGAELEKNNAPIASALITCSKLSVTDHIMGPSNRDKGPLSHLPQNVKMRVLPHSKEKNEKAMQ